MQDHPDPGAGERRGAPRYHVLPRFEVVGKDRDYLGYAADLSTGGMRVCGIDEQADLAWLSELTLLLPRWLGLTPELTLKGRVLWYRRGPKGMEAGFSFDRISRSTRTLLEGVIEELVEAADADGIEILLEDPVPSPPL